MRRTLCCALVVAIAAVAPSLVPAQGQSKTLVMRTALPDNPVEILGLTVGDKPVPLDRRSPETFDWSAPATLRIRNVSSKQIASATVELVFPSANAAAERLLLVVSFESAAPIAPNEEAVLKAQSGSFKLLSEKNARKGYKINFNRIRLEPSLIKFEDGTVWSLGTTFDRNSNASVGLYKPLRLPKTSFLKAVAGTTNG
jgi:hypothetical protein